MMTYVRYAMLIMFSLATVSLAQTGGATDDRMLLSEACQALSAPEKRSACLEAINRLSQSEPAPSQAKAAQPQSQEPITLKGVPFDTPGVKNSVEDLCTLPNEHYKRDRWCNFNKKGRISIPKFSYGNLNELSWAVVDNSGALVKFETSASKADMLELATLLAQKYGVPTVTEKQIENRVGTKFDQKVFVWSDQRGTRITLYSIYDRIDTGKLVIESASLVQAGELVQKLRNEVGKGNL